MKFLFNLPAREVERFTPSPERALGVPVPNQYWPYDRLVVEGWQGLYSTDETILGAEEVYQLAAANYHNEHREWLKVSREMAAAQLGAVPPVLHRGDAFACGEPWNHTPAGEPVYLCFRQFNLTLPSCEAQYLTLREFTKELHHPSTK